MFEVSKNPFLKGPLRITRSAWCIYGSTLIFYIFRQKNMNTSAYLHIVFTLALGSVDQHNTETIIFTDTVNGQY